ncbi:MAG TPA: trypsin-like peptidase domain-containing protein [Streptosporangiaceae bacterium]
MDEERSGSEQQRPEFPAFPAGTPPSGSTWSASGDGTVERPSLLGEDTSQARGEPAAAAASPEPGTGGEPAAASDEADTAPGGLWASSQAPGTGEATAGGYENPTVAYPHGGYPPGMGYGPGYPGGYGPGYQGGPGGYPGGGYQGGYQGAGYPGSSYPPGAGYQGVYGAGGYPGTGGYPPGYGMPPGYGSDIIGGGYGQQRPPRRSRILTYVVVAALAAGVGAGTVLALRHNDNSNSTGLTLPGGGAAPGAGNGQPNGNSGANSSVTQSVASKVSPGIVDIISTPSFSGQDSTLEGTGMVVSHSGLVLTNNHVVEGTNSVEAKIANTGQIYKVTVLGTDQTHDVALLKLSNASNLNTVTPGDSGKVQIGETVVALGNAEGQDGSPTVVSGRITSLNQSIQASDAGAGTTENLHGMLQTNAPIVAGDSGGALADTQGQVIGMNTAANSAANSSAGGASMGFAIPINRALSIANQILSGHATSDIQIGLPAFLGVTVATSSSAAGSSPSTATSPSTQQQQLQNAADQNGFGGFGNGQGNGNGSCLNSAATSVPSTIPSDVSSGALVGGVLCRTPVAQAGISGGSVITSIDGQATSSPAVLTKLLTHYHPGNSISITWVAPNGQKHTSSVKLASGPAK